MQQNYPPPPRLKNDSTHQVAHKKYTLTCKAIAAPACVYFAVFLFACAALSPGYLSVDSYSQLFQFLRHTYDDWHPTIFAVSWSFLYAFLGVKGMLVFHLFCYFGAFFLCALLLRAKYKTPLATYLPLLFALLPWGLSNLSFIVKDVSLAVSVLLAISLLYFVQHVVLSRFVRSIALVLSALLLFYACNVRHLSFVPLTPAWIYFLYVLQLPLLQKTLQKIRFFYVRAAVVVGLAFACSVGSFLSYKWIVDKHILHTRHVFSSPQIPMFDLIGMHHFADGGTCIPSEIIRAEKDLPSARKTLDSAYCAHPFDGDRLASTQGYLFNYQSDFFTIWLRDMFSHPIAYTKHRLRFTWQFLSFYHFGFPNWATYAMWMVADVEPVTRGQFLEILQNNKWFGATMQKRYPKVLEAQADKMYLETVFTGNIATRLTHYFILIANNLGLLLPLFPLLFSIAITMYGCCRRHVLSLCVGVLGISYIAMFCALAPVITQMRFVYLAYALLSLYPLLMLVEGRPSKFKSLWNKILANK